MFWVVSKICYFYRLTHLESTIRYIISVIMIYICADIGISGFTIKIIGYLFCLWATMPVIITLRDFLLDERIRRGN